MEHIYLEIIQVISAYGCRCNFSLFYLQVVDKVENTLESSEAQLIRDSAYFRAYRLAVAYEPIKKEMNLK